MKVKVRKLKVKEKTKFVSIGSIKRKIIISSIKDSEETMITTKVEVQVVDDSNTSSFAVKEANRKGQIQNSIATSATKWNRATDADVPEAFIQLKVKRDKERKPITMQTLLGCGIFGSRKKSGLLQEKKAIISTTFTGG